MPGRVSGLSRQKSGLFRYFLIGGNQHAAARGSDNLIAVKGVNTDFSESSRMLSPIGTAKGLRRVLDKRNMMLFTNRHNLVQLCRRSVQMNHDNGLWVRIFFKSKAKRRRVHVPGVLLRVDKHGNRLFIDNGIAGCAECQCGNENHVSLSHPQNLQGQMNCRRSGAKRRGVGNPHVIRQFLFKSVHIRS